MAALGCGLMGSGIAHVSAQAGFKTIVREVNDAMLDQAAWDGSRSSWRTASRRAR